MLIAKIGDVVVVPCGEKPPCVFPRGEVAEINVLFTPNGGAESIEAKVYGYIGPAKVAFPLNKCTHPCTEEGCGLTCPLLPGKQYNYTVSIPVSKSYPPVIKL